MTARRVLLMALAVGLAATAAAVVVPRVAFAQQVATATTLGSSASPSVTGQVVTFTADVATVPPGGSPTGTVAFSFDAAGVSCQGGDTVALVSGAAQCQATGLTAAVPSVTVDASYSGDAGDEPSSASPLTQTVDQAATSVAVTAAGTFHNPARSGQEGHFVAELSVGGMGGGSPTGTITWQVTGANNLSVPCNNGGTLRLTATEVVSCTVAPGLLVAAESPYTVEAVYSGSAGYQGSSGTLSPSQVMDPVTTTTRLTGSPFPLQPATAVDFTAAVVGSKANGSPTGTLTFSFTVPSGAPAVTCAGGSDTLTLTPSDDTGWATCSLPSGFPAATPSCTAVNTTACYFLQVSYSGDGNDSTSQLTNPMTDPYGRRFTIR